MKQRGQAGLKILPIRFTPKSEVMSAHIKATRAYYYTGPKKEEILKEIGKSWLFYPVDCSTNW